MSKQSRPTTPKQAGRRRAAIDRQLDAEFFRALSDPTRIRLLACLAKCGRLSSVSEVAECCSVDISVVSRHLTMLARVGIVEAQKQGRIVFYRVCYESLSESLRSLADAIDDCCPAGSPAQGNCCDSC